MRRDKDLIRKLLLFAEERHDFQIGFEGNIDSASSEDFAGITEGDLAGHFKLLIDSKYLEGSYLKAEDGIIYAVAVTAITEKGYDLLDSIRDNSVWSEIKQELGIAGESWSMDVIAKLSSRIIAKKLGL